MHVQRLNSFRKRFLVAFFYIRRSGWHAKTWFNSQKTTSLLQKTEHSEMRLARAGKAFFRFLTLTLLLESGFALLLWLWLAWEHMKTLLPPAFTRRFRYKKGSTVFLKTPLQFNFHWGERPCFGSAHCTSTNELHFKEVFAKSWSHNYFIWEKKLSASFSKRSFQMWTKFIQTHDSNIFSGNIINFPF